MLQSVLHKAALVTIFRYLCARVFQKSVDSLITAYMCVCLRVHEHTCVESFEADIHPTTITAVLAPQMKADM